jgi:hypothetical protein
MYVHLYNKNIYTELIFSLIIFIIYPLYIKENRNPWKNPTYYPRMGLKIVISMEGGNWYSEFCA